MEKFAVDLDKVLDDFEFNEEHSLTFNNSSTSIPSTQFGYTLQNVQLDATHSNLQQNFETDLTLPAPHSEVVEHQKNNSRYYHRNEVISNFTNITPINYNLAQSRKPDQPLEYLESDHYYPPDFEYSQTNVPTNFQPTSDIRSNPKSYVPNFEHYENNSSLLKNVSSTTSQNVILKSDEMYENVDSNIYQQEEVFSTENLKNKLFKVVNKQPIVNYNIKTDSEEIKPVNSNKKHSVSNVFNSLHEYINTDVKNINNSQFIENDTSETLPDLLKTNNLDHKRHFQVIHNTLSDDTSDKYSNETEFNSKMVKNTNQILYNNQTQLDTCLGSKTTVSNDKINNVEKSITDFQKSTEELSIITDNMASGDTVTGGKSIETIQSTSDKLNECTLYNQSESKDSQQTTQNQECENVTENSGIEEEIEITKPVIGFDENIDVSDSEIENYLDELEKETDLLKADFDIEQNNILIKRLEKENDDLDNKSVELSDDNLNKNEGETSNETSNALKNKINTDIETTNDKSIESNVTFSMVTLNEVEETMHTNQNHNKHIRLDDDSEVPSVIDNNAVAIDKQSAQLPTITSQLEISDKLSDESNNTPSDLQQNVTDISHAGEINQDVNKSSETQNDNFKQESHEHEKKDSLNESNKDMTMKDSLEETQVSNVKEIVSQQEKGKVLDNSLSTDTTSAVNDTNEKSEQPDSEKRAALCRPNSLDLATNVYTTSEDENNSCIAPPGETPGPTTSTSNVNITDTENTQEKDSTETNVNDPSSELNLADCSPSTSEVSSIENNDSLTLEDQMNSQEAGNDFDNHSTLGKKPPYWMPDFETDCCMHCGKKFTFINRRHHCRACGLVLCGSCCSAKLKLEYLGNVKTKVCIQCKEILSKDVNSNNHQDNTSSDSANNSPVHTVSHPNPNNPMEYCSTVPPLQQIENQGPSTPPTVMVPVGVLKRQGSTKSRSEKTVMFSDGIRPGCDLTELDNSWDTKSIRRQNKRVVTPPGPFTNKVNRSLPHIDPKTMSYIPVEENCLPPTMTVVKADITYQECSNNKNVVEMLKNETLVFALQRNFSVQVKIVNLNCCVNKQVWCFSTQGLSSVGQDEIVILLELLENEAKVPKDIFLHLNNIYSDASKGNTITEMGFSIQNSSNFLGSKNHAGFLYVRPTFQCLQNILLPSPPYLIGILIHRWETPWVKIFPLRLLLRLGAEYRYYPCPLTSTRNRESVYVEIGHTIINLLADFRNFSFTLPNVRGLIIHMEERKTTVLIPKNRYDQVIRALNNSSEHILAFAGNFSSIADSHLVCIQDINGISENGYSTHAINIQDKPRKVTGASFIILNGALKTTSGLTAKSSLIEDGLMIHILPDQMVKLRESLRNMKPFEISCGCVNSESDGHVNLIWTDNDINFNIGVKSPIDNRLMDGIPSIRVHNGADHIGTNRLIRWTEVFIIQSGEDNSKAQDSLDISKLSENISKSTCQALFKYLDLLATNNFYKIAIRATLHSESVSYEAGSNGVKLAPIYMKSLDNELIPVLHNITSNNLGESPIVLELIFHILNF